MNHIQVDNKKIDNMTAQMNTCITEIDKILDTLDSKIKNLLGSWSGDASDAYARAHKDYDASLRELSNIAKKISNIAESGNRRFQAMENADAAVWGS